MLQEKSLHVTRFIALSKVNNPKKLKWLYAFNVAPMATMPAQKLNEQPAGATPCPYDGDMEDQKEKSEARKEALGNQFFYDVSDDVMAGNNRQGTKRRHPDNKRPPRPPPKPMGQSNVRYPYDLAINFYISLGPCWFCLSSPEVEKHLVISVGDHVRRAILKADSHP